MDYAENLQRCRREYIDALEEERRKIQVFHRELPLCLQLVSQAIDACKQQISGTTTTSPTGQSECSVQTITSEDPVHEHQFNFIPLKRCTTTSSSEFNDEEEAEEDNNSDKSSKKSDWLRSVQLWNHHQISDPPTTKEDSPRKASSSLTEGKRSCGAFKPFRREKDEIGCGTNESTEAPASSTADAVAAARSSGGVSRGELLEKEGQCSSSQRKMRRCWSPELHRRFLNALQQLGGAHVATPKQIRELMKVDGLTNDEVKSHLQKYRLHTKRPGSSNHSSNDNALAPQFVVVGGVWVQPAATAAATSSEEAPPLTSASAQLKEANSDDDEREIHGSSPSASSSIRTTAPSLPVL